MPVYKRKDRGGRRGTYYAAFTDLNGKRIKFNTHTTDKQEAEDVLAARKSEDARRRFGITDAESEKLAEHAKRPLAEHLEAFIAHMEAKGRTKLHVERTKREIETVATDGNWSYLSDVSASSVEKFAKGLRDQKQKPRTIASYIQSCKAFSRWLAVDAGRLPSDPLRSLKKPNPHADRKLVRRALTVEEWQALKRLVAEKGSVSFSMPADARLLVYETALQTGLRSSELRVLTRGRLHLDGAKPFVTVPSRSTKDKRPARQYITPELGKRLHDHVARKTPGAPVFGLPDPTNMAAMLRADLELAREAWIAEAEKTKQRRERAKTEFLKDTNHDGESIDFHALRHTCGAWLALAGVHPKAIQSVMRHKDIKLTLDTYGHLFPSMEAEAVDKLARMIGGEKPADVARAPKAEAEPEAKPRGEAS